MGNAQVQGQVNQKNFFIHREAMVVLDEYVEQLVMEEHLEQLEDEKTDLSEQVRVMERNIELT